MRIGQKNVTFVDPNSPRGICYVNNSYKYLKLLGIFFINKRMGFGHRYRPEIPEPVPSLSQHGAQIGGIQVFSHDQINGDLSGPYLLRSEREYKYP